MSKIKLGRDGFEMNVEIIPNLLPADTLFIHGNLGSNVWWHPSLEVWKSQARPEYKGRAILAEWRGCGDSDAPASESELEIGNLAEDYLALLTALEIKRTHLVGHSTGGLIALFALARKPEFFDRGFLLDPVSTEGRELTPELEKAFLDMSLNRELCALVLGSTIYGNDFSGPLFASIMKDAWRVSKYIWLGIPRALNAVKAGTLLKQIKTTVTIAHGEFDRVLPIERSKAMADLLENGTFLELKNQGHCMNVENPNEFVSLVNQALFNKKG